MLRNEKIVGYALLFLGITLLLFSIFEMFNVYYGNATAPKLFELQDISLSMGQSSTGVSLIQGTQLSQIADLLCWFLLMGFVLFGGGKIASLGVNMIKDIQVQIKDSLKVTEETKEN
jgi:hypothetical protein